ncbi:MAG: RidA family protein [Gammaproteobacteria bacterium]
MSSAKREELRVPGLHEPVSHYTDAVRFGDLLFISGIVALDENMQVVGEDAATQTRTILGNIEKILTAAGAGFCDVLRVTVYLTDIADRERINPVRQAYFGEARPASTLVEVSALVLPELKVEIEAVVGLPR